MGVEKLRENGVSEILLIPYSHHDYEWCCTRAWHKWRYIRIFCDALDRLKEDPAYTWCIDNIVHSWIPFARYCPERVEEFKAYVKAGRICVLNGGVSLARPSLSSEETYIRNMIEGRRLFQEMFGLDDIPVLYNADTAAGHSQLPQIALLGGHRYYRFQRPDSLLTAKGVPMQFWWEGLDGSRVLTTRGPYGGFWDDTEWLGLDAGTRWEEKKRAFFEKELADKVNGNGSTDTVLQFVGCDDCRPGRDFHDRPIPLEEFMREWNEREPIRMRYATLGEAYAVLEKKDVPVWKGVLDHAELSYNLPQKGVHSMWRRRLELDRLLTQLEKLCMIAERMGMPYPEAEIRALWRELFEITGHAIEDIQARDDEELREIAGMVRSRAEVMIRRTREHIVNSVRQERELQFVVIGTLNWRSEQTVRLQVTGPTGLGGFDLVDAEGNKLPYQVTDIFPEYRGYEGSEYAGVEIETRVSVPAMGYTTLTAVPNEEKLRRKVDDTFIDNLPSGLPPDAPETVILENGSVTAEFSGGALTALRRRENGRTVEAEGDRPAARLEFVELAPASSWLSDLHHVTGRWQFVPEHGKVLAGGPVRWTYRVDGTIRGERASVTYTLNAGSPGLDVCVEYDFREAVEGMMVFGVRADAGSDVYADIPFGAEKREFFDGLFTDPATGRKTAPDEWEFPGQIYARNWVCFQSGETPVAVVSKNCGAYYDYDRELGEMRLLLTRSLPMRYRTDRWFGECPSDADVIGPQEYEMSVVFAEEMGRFRDLQRYHKTRIYPAAGDQKFGFPGSGAFPPEGGMLDTDRENVICTAVYREDGRRLARFFECDGKPVTAEITLPPETRSVRAVDFCGNTLAGVGLRFHPERGSVEVPFGAFKIVTLEWT